MWRHLYSIGLTLSLPLLIGHVMTKYRRQGQRARVGDRIGLHGPKMPVGGIWIHACSLGEAKVAMALADELIAQGIEQPIWFTATTPAGLNEFERQDRAVAVFPWDLPWVWSGWLVQTQPSAVVLIETELWPNLIAACHQAGIPVCLANGRLSERALTRYQRIRQVAEPMWQGLTLSLMQSKSDGERAEALGVPRGRILITGSIKLDQSPPVANPDELNRLVSWKGSRPLICLMSSHPDEEAQVLSHLDSSWPVLFVPRHPVRAQEVARVAESQGRKVALFSDTSPLGDAQVVIGDTFGDMGTYLSASEVVLIGGTWVPHGGQNPIEPAILGKPLVAGPWVFNFSAIVDGLAAAGGLVSSPLESLTATIQRSIQHGSSQGEAAKQWVLAHQGATAAQAAALIERLGLGRSGH